MSTQPCKICHGTGHVECPSQLCAHWCSCTVCNGTGKVEVYEDWSQGHLEETVRAQPFRGRWVMESPQSIVEGVTWVEKAYGRARPKKVNTINICGYEFPVVLDSSLPEGELRLIGQDENLIVRSIAIGTLKQAGQNSEDV